LWYRKSESYFFFWIDQAMTRFTSLSPDQMSPEQRKVHDAVVAGPRGKMVGPIQVWLTNPELAQKAQELGAFCRYGTGLEPRLSELAILITGAHWKAGYEWHVHAPIGMKAGLDPQAVEAIRCGEQPSLPKPDEAAVYAFAKELLETRRVSDASFARATKALGERGVVELVGILGYYTLISMTIVSFEMPVPEGSPEPFAG
jgi:4-carboxymuconolactone decarboxylase